MMRRLKNIALDANAVSPADKVWRPEDHAPMRAKDCEECGVNIADYRSGLCPGCEAYRDHTA